MGRPVTEIALPSVVEDEHLNAELACVGHFFEHAVNGQHAVYVLPIQLLVALHAPRVVINQGFARRGFVVDPAIEKIPKDGFARVERGSFVNRGFCPERGKGPVGRDRFAVEIGAPENVDTCRHRAGIRRLLQADELLFRVVIG